MTTPVTELSYDDLRQIELQLFADIRRLSDVAAQLLLPQVEALNNLQALIADNHFSIAVVGEFKRGKSTFINALLGEEVLPAAIEACSATLNRITYGRTPRARVVLHGEGTLEERSRDVPLAQLADYVTKLTPESRQMSAAVEEAVISFPSHFCRNNVDLIDTPGLNDDDVMTRITLDAIARVNAAILIIRASIPFGESEQRLLEKLLDENIGTILFAVTAIDEIVSENRERLLAGIKTRIKRAVQSYVSDIYDEGSDEHDDLSSRFANPQVYGLSAYQSLEARGEKNSALEQESGIPAFEQVLESLLAAKDGAEHVRQVAKRLAVAADEVVHQIAARSADMSRRNDILEQCAVQAHEALAVLAPKLGTLRASRNTATHSEDIGPEITALVVDSKISAAQHVEQLSLDIRSLVHAGLHTLHNPHFPIELQPDMQSKLEDIASYNPGLDVEPIITLKRQICDQLLSIQQVTFAAAAEQVRNRLGVAYEEGVLICAAADDVVLRMIAQLEVVWPDHPLQPVSSVAAIEQRLHVAQSQLTAWNEDAIRQAEAVLSFQIQPTAVALRTAIRALSNDPSATPPLTEAEAISHFRSTCIRSVASDIDHNAEDLKQIFSQLMPGIADPSISELYQIPARAIGSLLDLEQGLVATLRKARVRLEGRTEAELRDLELRRAEVKRIAVQARQLLQRLRKEEHK